MTNWLSAARTRFLDDIVGRTLARRTSRGPVNAADSASRESCEIAQALVSQLGRTVVVRTSTPQALGTSFTEATRTLIEAGLVGLLPIRPARWEVRSTNLPRGIAAFDQYRHLWEIKRHTDADPGLRATLGTDYLVKPDIVVVRVALSDAESSAAGLADSGECARYSPLLARNGDRGGVLHASVSCKWTIRSDRAQNVRTEALNLLRNRKGRAPHAVVVTFEPLPQRIASVARGTGDIDCVYHGALPELERAVSAVGSANSKETINELVAGRRLRDISDLPLDLAI